MASYWFNEGAEELVKGTFTWGGSTIKARLATAVPVQTITNMSTVTKVQSQADETLAGKSVVKDDTNNQVKFVANNVVFGSVPQGGTAEAVVVFWWNTQDSDSIPICVHDISTTSTNGGDITIDWPTVNSQDGTVCYTSQPST